MTAPSSMCERARWRNVATSDSPETPFAGCSLGLFGVCELSAIGAYLEAEARLLAAPRLRGTRAPARRASDRPIAIACLRLVTFLPEPPLRNLPCFISRMTRSTFLPLDFEYLRAIELPPQVVDRLMHQRRQDIRHGLRRRIADGRGPWIVRRRRARLRRWRFHGGPHH
ncbi:MAG: hypothetical protein ACRESY_06785 [Steroidobacteraceae bacterium]